MVLVPIELVIAVLAALSWGASASSDSPPRVSWVLWLSAGLTAVAAALGGLAVAAMAFKVLLFGLCMAYARWHPTAASRWLLLVIVLHLAIATAQGSLGTKLGALPLLLLATLWGTRTAADQATVRWVFALALCGECAQALLLGSRGGLLSVALAVCLWVVPLGMAKRGLVFSAVALPVLYPLALTAALLSMLLGLDLIEPTASNVERSTLSAWCIDKSSQFLLPGPGGSLYEQDTNDLGKLFSGISDRGIIDPHHFPLSAWVWLGTLPTLALHLSWCAAFWRALRDGKAVPTRHHLVLGALALLTYTLSPPDSAARLMVALQSGIALAGFFGTAEREHPTWRSGPTQAALEPSA